MNQRWKRYVVEEFMSNITAKLFLYYYIYLLNHNFTNFVNFEFSDTILFYMCDYSYFIKDISMLTFHFSYY